MKTWKKTLLISGISLTLIGGGLALAGLQMGALSDLKQETVAKHEKVSTKLDTFSSISIDTSVYSVHVKETDSKTPAITYLNNQTVPVSAKVTKGVLKVTDSNSQKPVNINFFGLRDFAYLSQDIQQDTIIITVPKGTELKSLTSQMAYGDLTLSHLSIDQLNTQQDSGDNYWDHLRVAKGKISHSAGDLDLSYSQFEQVAMSVDTGDIDLDTVTLTNSEIQASTGEVTGDDLAFRGFNSITSDTGDVDLGLGDYNLNVSAQSDTGDSDITDKLIHSRRNTLDIDASLGDITVD